MGLDSVELLMEIEQRFGINIPDEEAETITTVQKMYDAVWQHLGRQHSDKCKSQILFYKCRKYFESNFHILLPHCKLDELINTIFPKSDRRNLYKKFGEETNLELPSLILTETWKLFLNIFGIICIAGSLFVAIIAIIFFEQSKWLLIYPVVGIIITILISNMLETKRVIIEQITLKNFIQQVLILNYSKLSNEFGNNRKEVEFVINQIIVEKVGVELEEISPEKSFTDDLGVD